MTLASGTHLGSYEVLAPIGAGGMGEVYRARDTKLGREVALKILPQSLTHDPDRIARFTREAQVLASLNHPNIGAIYGLDEANDQQFLVLELIEGETLADRIAKSPIPVDEALAIARQIAEALEAAHDQGIIHRDLKPANIKVRPDGTVKVLDFGLAKLTEPQAASATSAALMSQSPTITTPAMMTSIGVILGTAAYMSPEQASGKTADRRADIWGFGAVLYEMLAGTRAFAGESVPDTLATILKVDPTWAALPRSTPASICTLVKRCLEKDRKKRLQAIGEARITIENTLNAPSQDIIEPQFEGLRHRVRHVWPWVATAALSLALAAAVSFVHFREVPPLDRSVRFQVPPPEKSIVRNFQLSPDGAYLAFTGGEGVSRLWVRPLDGLEAQALPGTDGASFPFWSPDSAFIGFFAQGKLKRISITGGPTQTLCDAVASRGGTWNSDGVILIVPPSSVSLYRVSAAGGVTTPVTQAGTGEIHIYPRFLPGGRRFLYAVSSSKPGASGVYVGSLDGTAVEHILPERSRAVYVPPRTSGHTGYLVFSRDTTVMAQPFDPDRLLLTGDVSPIAERASGAPATEFSVSENGALAYVSGEGSRELVWMDRSGRPLDSAGPTGGYVKIRLSSDDQNFRLSPDDKRVAFDRGNRDIWVLDMIRGVPTRLTSAPGANNIPSWSPDGLRIFFPSNRNGTFDLYVKSATGAGQEEVLVRMGTPTGWGTDWSRDARYILYQIPGGQTGQDLWVAPQFGDRKLYPYLQTQFNEQEGRFAPSPDGVPHWVAYVSDETGGDEIYVQPFPRSGEKKRISIGGGSEPIWRSDGTELFYLGADRNLMAVPIRAGTTVEAGVPKALFPVRVSANQSSLRNYAVAGDGQHFLVGGLVGDAAPMTVVLNWQAGLKK